MGHRANYVVIRRGKVAAYQDHWGALACTFALMDGPDHAADVDAEKTDELMAWAWAEAGYLLDFDRKVAIVFGMPDLDPDALEAMPAKVADALAAAQVKLDEGPQAYLEHVAPRFPGWTLTWDERGVDAFADHLRQHGLAAQLKAQPPSAGDVSPAITITAPAAKVRVTKKKKPVAEKKKPATAKKKPATAKKKPAATAKKKPATAKKKPATAKKKSAAAAKKKSAAAAKKKRQ